MPPWQCMAGCPYTQGLCGCADLASSTEWQPRGILVAHLAEHRRAINRIAVARGAAFFVTASDDETCKIWDSRRLEKDISFRSKLTYASQVERRPTALAEG